MSKKSDHGLWFDDECDEYRIHRAALKGPDLFNEKSQYQRIQIKDTVEYGRMLALDGSPQSAEADERIYHESLVHPAGVLLREPPKDILILGGGEGATAREALRYKNARRVITVDIDEVVVEAAREYLSSMRKGADGDPRSRFFIGDAKEFLESQQEFSMAFNHPMFAFDLIVSDISDPFNYVQDRPEQGRMGDPEGENVAARCYTPEFFKMMVGRLQPHGIFVMQSQELSRVVWQGHKKHREMLRGFFKYVYSYRRYVPSFNYEQSFILASNAEISNPSVLQPQIVDYLIKERISGNLEEFSGDMFCHMFALSPDLKKKLEIS